MRVLQKLKSANQTQGNIRKSELLAGFIWGVTVVSVYVFIVAYGVDLLPETVIYYKNILVEELTGLARPVWLLGTCLHLLAWFVMMHLLIKSLIQSLQALKFGNQESSFFEMLMNIVAALTLMAVIVGLFWVFTEYLRGLEDGYAVYHEGWAAFWFWVAMVFMYFLVVILLLTLVVMFHDFLVLMMLLIMQMFATEVPLQFDFTVESQPSKDSNQLKRSE